MSWRELAPRLALAVLIMGGLAWAVFCTIFQAFDAARCALICAPFIEPPPASPLDMRIVPQWYVLPTYGMLRAITFGFGPLDSKVLGLVIAFSAFAAPVALAFLNWSKTPARAFVPLIALPFVIGGLGYYAVQSGIYLDPWPLQALTAAYFAIFATSLVLARGP